MIATVYWSSWEHLLLFCVSGLYFLFLFFFNFWAFYDRENDKMAPHTAAHHGRIDAKTEPHEREKVSVHFRSALFMFKQQNSASSTSQEARTSRHRLQILGVISLSLMYFRSLITHPNLSVKHRKRRSFSFSVLIKHQEAWGHTVLCGKLCDHGNVVRQRHYWSDPYRGHAYSLPNQAFRSPTTTTRKTFQILFSSRVVSIDKRSVPLCKSKSIALFFFFFSTDWN